MLHYLLKATNEYRLKTVEEVEKFHKELQGQAAAVGYQLSSFGYVEKEVKGGGEVVDSYFVVKATFIFNNPKDPQLPIFDAKYEYDATQLAHSDSEEF